MRLDESSRVRTSASARIDADEIRTRAGNAHSLTAAQYDFLVNDFHLQKVMTKYP